MPDSGSETFYIHTVPGIEPIAWQEMQSRWPGAALLGFRRIRDKNGLVLFDYTGNPGELLQLGSAEDLFYLVAREQQLPPGRKGLQDIERAIREARYLEVGLQVHRTIRGGRAGGRTTFRVVARKEGGAHDYRRVDAQQAVEQGLLQRYNRRWRLVEEGAGLEFWFTQLDREALYGLRLSDASMRHRPYKLRHLPASLRPSVAHAMAFLCDPQPEDVFLDPMCGAGTILIERARMARYGQLLGGDLDPEAVAACRENIGSRYKPIEIRHWDATRLPLEAHSVDRVACNLPFGQQVGSHEDNQALYPRFIQEMVRVVRPGGRIVLLSGERQLMERVLAGQGELRRAKSYEVQILGRPAVIYVIQRVD